MDMIKRFFRKAVISYKALFGVLNIQAYVLIKLIGPMLHLIFFALVARYAYQTTDLTPWIIGNAMVLTYFNALFGVGAQMTGERMMGTLKILIASPANSLGIFLPRSILHTIDAVITVSFGLLAGALFFGFRIPLGQVPAFYAVILVGAFSAMCFGLFISSAGLLTRDLNMVLNVASMTLLTVTGANVAIERLPIWLRWAPDWLPLSRSIALGRIVQQGGSLTGHMDLLVGELLIGGLFALAGYAMFRGIERIAVRRGTLDLY